VALGGAQGIRVTPTRRVVAFAVTLAQQRRELLGEATRCFSATDASKRELTARRYRDDESAVLEYVERGAHFAFRMRQKAHYAGEGSRTAKSFTLEPVEKL